MSEQHEPRRIQQTMPEDGGGWHQINAGPHLHVMFHPNRQLLGREADGVERPSIVVAVAGKREQALRFDPFSMGSHYHIRPGLAGQIPLGVTEGQSPLDAALAFFQKPLRFRGTPCTGRRGRCGGAAGRRRPVPGRPTDRGTPRRTPEPDGAPRSDRPHRAAPRADRGGKGADVKRRRPLDGKERRGRASAISGQLARGRSSRAANPAEHRAQLREREGRGSR